MTHVTHPTPAQVREWMQQRQAERTPLPTPDQIRQQLGWHLLSNKSADCAR
jgi:hypothetical protein